ncbi:hypothetical protein ACIQGZ_28645 [Streptomyces sp. NPDC092296]|uniref:hypothetical protein n=1 Tax=Streptomyces sp. NPDC092296 TaxID=3366012 RepID=UPI00380C2BA2
MHDKTPYKWLRGQVPHAPVPEATVQLLSQALGTDLSYEQVWTRGKARSLSWTSADHGLDVAWDTRGLLDLLAEGQAPSMLSRRNFIAVSGAALTSPAWQAIEHPAPHLSTRTGGTGPVSEPVLQLCEEIVTRVQQLDDQQGGAAYLFVSDQFTAVSHMFRHAGYDQPSGRRLAACTAQLAQTAGFMAYDRQDDGDAQRWYLTGLRAAHAAADPALAASIMGLMSNQAADLGRTDDALQLAGSPTSPPPAVSPCSSNCAATSLPARPAPPPSAAW